MGEALAWGLIAASSLLLGGLLALRRPIGLRSLGLIIAFGAGVLISAVAYELVEEASGTAGGSGAVALGLLAGAFTFYFGDLAIDRFGGEGRLRAAWRVMVAERIDTKQLVFVDEMGTNTSLSPLYAWSLRGQRARSSAPRNRGANTPRFWRA